jgi:hypothetical protein
MRKKLFFLLATTALCCGSLFAGTGDSSAATNWWSIDGTTVCVATDNQACAVTAAAGNAGSTIIAWHDSRSGNQTIYAQRLDKNGNELWSTDGVGISVLEGSQNGPAIVSDGTGGAFIVWWDDRNDSNGQLFAQHVNADGASQWADNGIIICDVTGSSPQNYRMISDNGGGFIVAWQDQRNGGSSDIFAQKVNANGSLLWGVEGTTVCALNYEHSAPAVTGDGNGGAIIAWQDDSNGSDYDVYVQRLNADGVAQWATDGMPVCRAADGQTNPFIINDGSGGAIVAWEDYRSGNYDIYAQRLDADGGALWTEDGIAVCNADDDQYGQVLISDVGNGAIITWDAYDSVNSCQNIIAQRIDRNGNRIWNADGVALSSAAENQCFDKQTMTGDGLGGAIVTWDNNGNPGCIYAQRVNAEGSVQWGVQGSTVCSFEMCYEPKIESDGAGGAVIVWRDDRNGSDSDIMAQRLSNPAPEIAAVTPVSACRGETMNLTLSGKWFFPQSVLSLSGTGITVNSVTFSSETAVTARLTLAADAAPGARDLTLTNTNGSSVTVTNAFTVTAVQVSTGTDNDTDVDTATVTAIDPGTTATVSVTLPSGNAVTLDIAPATFASAVNLTVAPAASIPASTDPSLTTTALGLDITNNLGLQPLRDITITMHYRHADLGALDESKLVIALFDTARNRWVPIPSQVYPDLDEVVGRVAHLTTFALVQQAPSADLAGARAYPIPFNPASSALTIDRLTADAEVQLFTVAGQPVRTLAPASAIGTTVWDGKNDNGSMVASGVYIALIKSGAGTRKIKIAVER